MNTKRLAISGGVLSVAVVFSTIAFNYFNYEKQYSQFNNTDNKPTYSAHESRYKYWESLNANLETGKIQKSDFENILKQINARPSKKSAAPLSFIEEGPDNVGGRTRGICVDPNNTSIIYAGSVSGGLFKSTNKGGTWSPVEGFSNAVEAASIGNAVMSVSAIDMTNDGTLFVGTGGALVGEFGIEDARTGSQGAEGIWRSTDGGDNFSQVSGTENWDVTRIVAHPTENKFFVTGVGLGVRVVSSDGTISTVSGAVSGESLTDVDVSSDGNLVVCGRSTTYVSKDGGQSFSSASGIESGSNARYAISHEKNDNGFYNVFASIPNGGALAGIWMSPDSGTTWYEIGPGGSTTFQPFGSNNQGWYDNIITVVKGRPNECIMGGTDLFHWELTTSLSNPTGQWTQISEGYISPFSSKYVHVDQHEMEWDNEGNLYIGNDGGIFTYIAPFPDDIQYIAFKHLVKDYNVTQFYSLSASSDGSILAGAQDNGTQLNNHTGFTFKSTYEIFGGDGYDCEISQINSDAILSSSQQGTIGRSDDGGGNQSLVNIPCNSGNCEQWETTFTLQEIERDANTQDIIEHIVLFDTIIQPGDDYKYEAPSENFAIPLHGIYTNATASPVTLTKNTIFQIKDSVQALCALSVPETGKGVYVTRDIWKFGQNPEWWNVLSDENGFQKVPRSLKFSRDGRHLFVGTDDGEVWRVDGIGDAYSKGQADINNAVPVNPQDGKRGIIQKIDAPISAVNTGARIFTVTGNFTTQISNGSQIRVSGSTANNGIYTVSSVVFNAGNTEITVTSAIPSAIADGVVNVYFTAPFSLDFYNNTYYNLDGTILPFKLTRYKIYDGSAGQIVTDIAVNPNDPNDVVITLGTFSAGQNILRSSSAATTTVSTTFTSIHGSGANALPRMPMYAAIIDKDNANTIYVGTVFGLWYTTDGGTTWNENNEQIGRVPVFALRQDVNESNENTQLEGAIYLATHGRGYWSTNKFLSTEEPEIEDNQTIKNGLSIYPNPTSDVVNLTYELQNSSNVTVNIVSIDGKMVKSIQVGGKPLGKHRNNINVESLPKGMYILQVKTDTDSKVAKFIKQ